MAVTVKSCASKLDLVISSVLENCYGIDKLNDDQLARLKVAVVVTTPDDAIS